MGYDILELPEIPREREKLKSIIGQARYRQRKRKIIQTISLCACMLGVVILLLGSCSRAPAAKPHEAIYLPIIATR